MEDDVFLEFDEEDGVKVEPSEPTSWTIIARYMANFTPNTKAMFDRFTDEVWFLRSGISYSEQGKNYMVTLFSKGDYDFVMRGGPWIFKQNALIVKDIDNALQPSETILDSVPVWVRIYNVPWGKTRSGAGDMELEVKMCEAWDSKWPWQVRQLEEKKFLVRIPPHKKISDLVDIPSINLKEGNDMERVTVKIIGWEGDIPDVGELKTCWVQIRGIPPKWVSWEVIAQIAKTLGLLLDVDWGTIFKSFYEVVRVQLAVKDIHKIPEERIYVMKKKFYWVIFDVEKVAGDGGNDSNNDDNDPDGEDPGCGDEHEGFD
ncbi:hypothetical protein ACQ4PT_025875 [Festuca glaucescens]